MAKKLFLLIVVVTLIFVQCKREPLTVNRTITPLSDYESNDGMVSIKVAGGKAPYEITWSNETNDTVISNLVAGTYYVTVVDAKSRTAIDTIEVTQPAYPVCIDAEGNNYKTAILGNQIWMIENLRTTSAKGESIESLVYDDNETYADSVGRLYTWQVTMADSVAESTQGICPDGWHIPSDKEWFELTDYVTAEGLDFTTVFEPQYAGFYNNGFNNIDVSVSYWSSTKAHDNAWKRYFHKELTKVFRYHENKKNAISVRCVKN